MAGPGLEGPSIKIRPLTRSTASGGHRSFPDRHFDDDMRSKLMNKRLLWFAMTPALLFTGIAVAQQYPMMDMVADKLVQRYQQSSCEQLWQERAQKQGRPKSGAMRYRTGSCGHRGSPTRKAA